MFNGLKTYISAGVLGILTVVEALGIISSEDAQSLVRVTEIAALVFLRMGMTKMGA